ncbi:hypothetical protein [Shewanella dokdonensis]|nr:hypothetical protein [Shewanella dokdonensis]MCL1073723.1 hypothetical protein [Shewanella dokdonensis]
MAIASFGRFAASALIAVGAWLPLPSTAATAPQKMEVITVTYIGSVNYALYQQFAETMSELHFALVADIHDTAKNHNQQMAQQFMTNHATLLAKREATIETTAYANNQRWRAR